MMVRYTLVARSHVVKKTQSNSQEDTLPMSRTTIEWTDTTWNPVTGCTKVSPGCTYCYAERMAKRLQAMGQPNYVNGFRLTLQPHMLELPLKWKKPRGPEGR